jgi:hypothetical protein
MSKNEVQMQGVEYRGFLWDRHFPLSQLQPFVISMQISFTVAEP